MDTGREDHSARAERTGLVLCGGQSRRMGRDKALIELDGRRLLEHALAALEPVCGALLLACGATPRYGELGIPLVLDGEADRGPLSGLCAGLEAARTEWVIAVGCDMPDLSPQVLEQLVRHAQEHAWDVTMLGTEKGSEPLCAVYRRSCLPAVRSALARGAARLTAFHDGVAAPPGELRLRVAVLNSEHFPPALRASALHAARNLNTPSDLEALGAERSARAS